MDRAQSVSESEMKIMRILWKNQGSVMLAPLMEALHAQGNQWKANTVLTFLSRLGEKGMLRIDKVGRLNQYTALLGEEDYMALLTKEFVGDIYGGNAMGLIASLLRTERLSKHDLEELRAFWEEAKSDG